MTSGLSGLKNSDNLILMNVKNIFAAALIDSRPKTAFTNLQNTSTTSKRHNNISFIHKTGQ